MREKASLANRLQCVLLLLVVARTAATAGVIYVDADAPGANNGSSWENAYVFLQDALADAKTAEKPIEIHVAQGVYKPNQRTLQTPNNGDNTFTLINEVTVKGGYAGCSEPDPNTGDIETFETILSGDLNSDDIFVEDPCDMLLIESNRGDNSRVVVRANHTNATAVLDGFVITGGYFMDMYTGPPNGGAGMHIYQGSPTIRNCTFAGNAAREIGGGLLNRGGSNPTLVNCTFIGNYAESGGGIYNTPNIPAPGMISEGSHPTLVNCTFENNCAFKNGGGIYNFLSNPTLTGCVFRNNMVIGPYSGSTRGPQSGGGGGMYNKNSSPVLTNCLFSENSAGYGGGIYNVADSNVTLFDCTFNGNLVSVRGGGLSNRDDCNLTMTNCLIVSNWAKGYGGGIFCNGEITLLNCTIVGNRTSSYDGGGIYFQVGRIDNSIIYGNITAVTKGSEIAQDPHGQAGCLPELINITHSIIGSDPNAFDIPRCYSGEWRHADPLFVDPGYWDANGTPDDPNDDFWIDGDYHLKSQAGRWDPVSESWVFDDVTSPCIDAGDPNSPVAFEPFPNGGIINMGTYGSTAEASKSPSGIHAKYGGGTGEPNNPYLIYTAEHMNTIGTEPNDWDKHFKLMADIDLDPNLPDGKIYDEAIIRYFKGVFDGNGHTISNFSYTSSDGYSIGLFRKISGQNTQIKDLGLIAPDIYVESGSHIGSLVGMVSSGTISNCYAEGGNVSGEELVGGLVGLNHGNLNDCYSTCNVYGDDEVGGLVGLNSSTTITNCSAGGEVFGRNCVAGLAGSNSGTIKNSSALGSITVEKHSIVTRDNRSFGGLIGRNSGPLIGCTAGGDVSGDVFVGGLVGNSSASIINCYATGSVLGTDYVGGLVGSIGATIENCYAIGGVSGTTYVGGLVGYKDVEAKVMASFWDIQTSDWATSDGGTSKSTVEMYTASTFLNAGWDFVDETANGTEDIWWILEGQDYPRLWWEMINEK